MSKMIVAAVLVLGLTGCAADGSAGADATGETSETPSSPAAEVFPGCPGNAGLVGRDEPFVSLDLDGDGVAEEIALVTDGECRGAIVTRTSDEPLALDVRSLDLEPETAASVQLPGRAGELLLVNGGAHPRGGFQPHLFGLGPDGLAEVTADGGPVLGFVATDGGQAPTLTRCTEHGRIETVSAVGPRGADQEWQVRSTSFAIDGTTATPVETAPVADTLSLRALRQTYAGIEDVTGVLENCRTD